MIVSSRHGPVGYKWTIGIEDASMLVRMKSRKMVQSVDTIDAIIFCIGYRHSYPFMAKRFHLYSGGNSIHSIESLQKYLLD